jgi:hypothetical protein
MARESTLGLSYLKTNAELSDPTSRLVELKTDAEQIRSNAKAQGRLKDISITKCQKRKIALTTDCWNPELVLLDQSFHTSQSTPCLISNTDHSEDYDQQYRTGYNRRINKTATDDNRGNA